MQWQPLVPELVVTDFNSSLHFYTRILGFTVKYSRAHPSFAYLEFERSQLMIEELQDDSWLLGALERPFGRGMNLMIECADVTSLRQRIAAADIDVYREIEDDWYQTDTTPVGRRQFLVADPDGYLLRFSQVLGAR